MDLFTECMVSMVYLQLNDLISYFLLSFHKENSLETLEFHNNINMSFRCSTTPKREWVSVEHNGSITIKWLTKGRQRLRRLQVPH